MEVTQWFSWREKPFHEGWYDFKGFLIPICRLYWDGRCFGYWLGPQKNGIWIKMAADQYDQWRGLAEQAGKQE